MNIRKMLWRIYQDREAETLKPNGEGFLYVHAQEGIMTNQRIVKFASGYLFIHTLPENSHYPGFVKLVKQIKTKIWNE